MSIQRLPDHVINQIAAGEVIERPFSIVRELVDNALDAGATRVRISLEGGGNSRIVVSDNGCGMSSAEILLALQPHTTSKLKSIDDLRTLSTYGFRGEALPSIASISRVTVISRKSTDEIATCLQLVGGSLQDQSKLAAEPGTSIEVQAIFFNVPARRKFLKSDRQEEGRIKRWVLHSAITNPQVRYQLECDGKEILNLPHHESALQRAKYAFKGESLSVGREIGPLKIEGLIAPPAGARYDTTAFAIFVNNRLVFDKLILKAVREGYQSTLKGKEYPVGFISIHLPPNFVDVNVHPQKSEVRFSSPQAIFRELRQAIVEALKPLGQSMQHFAAKETSENIPVNWQTGAPAEFVPQSFDLIGSGLAQSVPAAPDFRYAELKYIARVLDCYLICEDRDRLVVIDMHAAHERCRYNLIRERMRQREIETQMLLVPLRFELGEEDLSRAIVLKEALQEMGFELKFEDSRLSIQQVPAFCADLSLNSFFSELFSEEASLDIAAGIEESIDKLAQRMACHSSIRSGYELSREEAFALFDQLDRAEISGACPHGRPIARYFSRTEVERWFGRDR